MCLHRHQQPAKILQEQEGEPFHDIANWPGLCSMASRPFGYIFTIPTPGSTLTHLHISYRKQGIPTLITETTTLWSEVQNTHFHGLKAHGNTYSTATLHKCYNCPQPMGGSHKLQMWPLANHHPNALEYNTILVISKRIDMPNVSSQWLGSK